MAELSCEKHSIAATTPFLETVRTGKFIKDLTGVRGGFLFFLPSHCSTQILTLIVPEPIGTRIPVSCKICCDIRLLIPLSAFGR